MRMSRMVPPIFFVDATMRKDSASHDAEHDDQRSNDGEKLTEQQEMEKEEHLKNNPDDDRNETIKNLESQVVNRNETIKNFELQVVQKDKDIENLEKKVQELEIAQQKHMEVVSKIDAISDERQKTIEILQGELKVKEQQLLALQDNTGAQQLTKIYEEEKAIFQQRLAVQEKEIGDLKQKTQNAIEEKITCLDRLNALEAEKATLLEGIGSHEAVKSKLENDNNALKLSLKKETQEVARMQALLQAATNQQKENDDKLIVFEQLIASNAETAKNNLETIRRLEDMDDKAKQEVERMKTLLQEETKLREENNDKCVVFEQRIASNAEKAKKDLELIKQLQDSAARINNENDGIKEQLALAQAQVDTEQKECQQKEAIIKTLQLDIAQKEQTISSHDSKNNDVLKVRDELAQVQNLYDTQLAHNEIIKNETSDLRSQLEDIGGKLDREKEKCIQQEESIKELTSNIETSEQRLQQLTSSNDNFKNTIATLESNIAIVQKQKDDVQKESDTAKQALLEKSIEFEQLAKENNDMKSAAMDDAGTTAVTYKKEKDELSLANSQLTDKVTQQEVELQNKRDQIQRLEEQIDRDAKKSADAGTTAVTYKKENDQLLSANAQLAQKNTQQELELQRIRDKIQILEEKLDRTALKSASVQRELDEAIKDNLDVNSDYNKKMQQEKDKMYDLNSKLLTALVAFREKTRSASINAAKKEKTAEPIVNAFKNLLILHDVLKQIPTNFDAVSLEGLKQALKKEYTHGVDEILWNQAEAEIDKLIKSNEKAAEVEEIGSVVSDPSASPPYTEPSASPPSSIDRSPPPSTDPSSSTKPTPPPSTEVRSPKQSKKPHKPATGPLHPKAGLALHGSSKPLQDRLQSSSGRRSEPIGKNLTDNKPGDQSKPGAASKGGTKKTTAASSTDLSAESEARSSGNEANSEFRQEYDYRRIHAPGARRSESDD